MQMPEGQEKQPAGADQLVITGYKSVTNEFIHIALY